jgi:hypothetical protein
VGGDGIWGSQGEISLKFTGNDKTKGPLSDRRVGGLRTAFNLPKFLFDEYSVSIESKNRCSVWLLIQKISAFFMTSRWTLRVKITLKSCSKKLHN